MDGDTPLCTAELKASYGVQTFIHFNPEDVHFLVSNSDSQVIFYQWVSSADELLLWGKKNKLYLCPTNVFFIFS